MLYIYYDTDTFTVDPSADLSAAGVFRTGGSVIGNSIETAKSTGRYDGESDKDGVLALWYNGSGVNTTGDGAMLNVTLHAKESAANGSYTVSVGYSKNNTCNQNNQGVTLNTDSATVTVTSGSTSGGTVNNGGNGGVVNIGGTVNNGGTEEEEPEETEKTEETETVQFSDVAGNWAESYIQQAAELGLVEGYEGKYRPDDSMTRAEFVTVLWRLCGKPTPSGEATFDDLKENGWYLEAVAWAQENGVVNGIGNNQFDPDGEITREQLVTTLYRLTGKPVGMEKMFTSLYDGQYPDSNEVGSWAKDALYWSIYHDIYCGEASVSLGNTLDSTADADRAQVAVMVVRYLNQQ
jgi:hypothetical protein